MSLFVVSDIDLVLINHLDLFDDHKHLTAVNKYYNCLLNNGTMYKSWVELYLDTDRAELASPFNNCLFFNACQTNNRLCRLLIKKYNDINIHAHDEYAFRLSCKYGHLETSQWLIELSKQSQFGLINIHADNECAFRWSCHNGHLETSQWLIEVIKQSEFGFVNIHVDNEYAFLWSCYNGHLETSR